MEVMLEKLRRYLVLLAGDRHCQCKLSCPFDHITIFSIWVPPLSARFEVHYNFHQNYYLKFEKLSRLSRELRTISNLNDHVFHSTKQLKFVLIQPVVKIPSALYTNPEINLRSYINLQMIKYICDNYPSIHHWAIYFFDVTKMN